MRTDPGEPMVLNRSNGQQSFGLLASSTRTRLLLDGYSRDIETGVRILDLGCGNGAIGKAVADTFQASVVGVDVQNFLQYDVSFHLISGQTLPFGDKSFDIVMMNDVLHHTVSDRQADSIREAIRVGRKVLIFETEPTILAKGLDIVMNWVVYRGREETPLSHRTPGEWESLIEGLGMKCVVRRLKAPLFYPLHHFTVAIGKVSGVQVGTGSRPVSS